MPTKDELRQLLCDLGDATRDALIQAQKSQNIADFSAIAAQTDADTIYAIDRVSENQICTWFEQNWPAQAPVEVVMEGLEAGETLCFPRETKVENTIWKCILDPIDGTRGIMHDKRSAWSLAALAPQKGAQTNLSDIEIAAITELPTSKQWRADQISGVRGCGPEGLVCQAFNVLSGERSELKLRPSTAQNFAHGFASIARYFPEGKTLLSALETEIWDELVGLNAHSSPVIFDDQYIATGGQIYELMCGHDRMNGDLRPLALDKLGFDGSLACHPYDICAAFLAQELGVVIEKPDGSALDAPLDTTSRVVWMGYANENLAAQVRPLLARLMEKYFAVLT